MPRAGVEALEASWWGLGPDLGTGRHEGAGGLQWPDLADALGRVVVGVLRHRRLNSVTSVSREVMTSWRTTVSWGSVRRGGRWPLGGGWGTPRPEPRNEVSRTAIGFKDVQLVG